MTGNDDMKLEAYYEYVRINGKLQTLDHARQWSDGVLKTLGISLDRGTKRSLADALPQELADSLKGVFWLLHFRDPNRTSQDFYQRAGRRGGNSNTEFVHYPTLAVFGGLKGLVDDELVARVADTLSPELRQLWDQAQPMALATQAA